MDDLVYPILAVVITFLEVCVVMFCYTPQRLFANINCMLNKDSTQVCL